MNTLALPETIVIETERLTIRPIQAEDAPGFFALRQDAAVTAMMGFAPYTRPEEAERYVLTRMQMMAEGKCLFWTIALRESGAFIGSVCLWNFRLEAGCAEIGYELLPDFQKMGYASEAIRAVCQYANTALNFSCVDALVDPANVPSHRVLHRCGFCELGLMRRTEQDPEVVHYRLALS